LQSWSSLKLSNRLAEDTSLRRWPTHILSET
jgi:hypothetical protein